MFFATAVKVNDLGATIGATAGVASASSELLPQAVRPEAKRVESTTEKQLVLMDDDKGTFFHVQLGIQFKIIYNK